MKVTVDGTVIPRIHSKSMMTFFTKVFSQGEDKVRAMIMARLRTIPDTITGSIAMKIEYNT